MQGDDAADAVLIGHERPDDFYCTAEECVSAIADRGGPKLAVAVTVGTHAVDVAGQPVLTVLQDDGGSAAEIAARPLQLGRLPLPEHRHDRSLLLVPERHRGPTTNN